MDQDDRMAPNALRRLTDMARRNGSDIVLGKVASDFRGVALGLYRVNREVCTIHDAQLISSLTPHKMFRRAFLDEHGLRFPEGRRRLEDQLFVVKAYFAARVISILADEPCYFYLRRDDGANAGSNPTWIRRLLRQPARSPRCRRREHGARAAADAADSPLLPGAADRPACRPRFLTWTPDFRAEVFSNIRGVLIDYVDPDVDEVLARPWPSGRVDPRGPTR